MIIDKKSPWLNKNNNNIFLDEISFVEDPVSNPYYKPMEIFKWICKHKAKKLLFNALALFAPLFPVVSYKGQISSWQSPPPSGLGNVIFIIIGKATCTKFSEQIYKSFGKYAFCLEDIYKPKY